MMERDPLADVRLGGGPIGGRARKDAPRAANPGQINGKNIERGLTASEMVVFWPYVNSREGNNDRMIDRSDW